jgi:amidase
MTVGVQDYLAWDATEMAERVAAGDVRADELAETCRALIDAENPALNAVAELADASCGPSSDSVRAPRGPFGGVPFAVKEVLAYPGLHWTLGSRLFAANPSGPPTPYAERLRETGLRVVCSSTSSELGLLGSTESALHGPTVNPWGAGLSAAGSSGGAAALVAAGIVPMAHANDAGGSIRIPAAVTGLLGFKPSNGRCSPSGPDGPGLAALVVDHCISRTVRDSARLLAATERTGPAAVHEPIGVVDRPSPTRLSIGVLRTTVLGAAPEPAVAQALSETAGRCAALGHHVEELPPPSIDGPALSDAFFGAAGLAMAELAQVVTPLLGRPPGPDELEPFTLELIAWASTLGPGAAERTQAAFAAATSGYLAVFDRCDVVLTPTVPCPPWPLGHLAPGLGREELVERTGSVAGYTAIHNIAGCPAMSVPLAWAGGLPIGMHFAARPGRDAALLALAYELEEALPWRDRRPELPPSGGS